MTRVISNTVWEDPEYTLQIGSNMIHVWMADLSKYFTQTKAFESTLSLDERERASQYKFEKHRMNFVVARGILRRLLGAYLSKEAEKLIFSYNDFGKPYLHNIQNSLKFNLSHSGDLALYVFSLDFEVGIDVEQHHFMENIADIAQQFFCPAECLKLKSIPSTQTLEAFFKCWTRKEAFIKAIGQGLSHPLDQFEVTLDPIEPTAILKIYGKEETALDWSLHSLKPLPNYEAAFAFKGKTNNIKYYQYRDLHLD